MMHYEIWLTAVQNAESWARRSRRTTSKCNAVDWEKAKKSWNADRHDHRRNGSSSPVLTATSLSYKKAKNSTPTESNNGITDEMIKHGGPHLIEEIHQLCNKAWKTGIAPTE